MHAVNPTSHYDSQLCQRRVKIKYKFHFFFKTLLFSKVGAIDRAHARSTSARNVLLTVRMRTVNKCVKCAVDRAQARSTSA